MRRGTWALLGCALLGCTLNVFFFGPVKQDGPYDLSKSAVPAAKYDQNTFVQAADGTRIQVVYVQSSGAVPGRAGTAVLYCHGNSGNIGSNWDRVEYLYQMGYQMLAFDYRGYGRSDGTPSEAGVYEDADAALAYLLSRPGVTRSRVVLYGHSLGAAVCTELAKRNAGQVAGLILEAPFRSAADLVADNATVSLSREMVTTYSFDNYGKIDSIDMPLLIMHGTADDYVETRYGVELYDHALQPKTLWLVPGAGHSTIPSDPGTPQRQEYIQTVTGFVDGVVK